MSVGGFAKCNAAFSVGQPEMEVILQGQPFIEASIRSPREPQYLLLNGEKAAAEYDEADKLLRLNVKPR